jgi:LPXTG-site transpeptidase (sortase) family protein
MLRKPSVSSILVVSGGLLITLALIVEAVSYPWNHRANADEPPDPPLPSFEVISYAEYIEAAENEITETIRHDILPGREVRGIRQDLTFEEYEAAAIHEDQTGHEDQADDGGEEAEVIARSETPQPVVTPEPPRFVHLGWIKIPRLNVSENYYLGTGRELNHGIGHLEGTPMPGEAGNAVVAGHRTATSGSFPFRYVNLLESGDTITVNFNGSVFIYEVFENFIVSEHDVWVLQPIQGEPHILTLVTCDPVVITHAKNRIIVRARLAE